MEIGTPSWTLRRPCPCCGQGSALVVVACPRCARVALVCAEAGEAFLSVYPVVSSDAVEPENTRCPGCDGATMAEFPFATWEQIQSAGLCRDDVE